VEEFPDWVDLIAMHKLPLFWILVMVMAVSVVVVHYVGGLQ
jgi:hypothetical protein